MNRRNFCTVMSFAGLGWPLHGSENDPRRRLLGFARLAPSSHNTQPWRVRLTSNGGLELFADPSRLLPEVDPMARQTYISQGTFLELLEISARGMGIEAKCEYFPRGLPPLDEIGKLPVARVSFGSRRAARESTLIRAMLARQTNKRPFDPRKPLSEAQWAALRAAAGGGAVWRQVTAASERRALADLLTEAMAVEVASPARNRECAAWFRFSDQELAQRRDGFGVAHGGTTGPAKWFAETFVLSRARASDPQSAFARGAVAITGKQAHSAPAFAALVTSTNTPLSQVLAGRAYARVDLEAARQGIKIQPLSQALEEYEEMSVIRRRMERLIGAQAGGTVQMLFRLGHASAAARTPRRAVAELLRG